MTFCRIGVCLLVLAICLYAGCDTSPRGSGAKRPRRNVARPIRIVWEKPTIPNCRIVTDESHENPPSWTISRRLSKVSLGVVIEGDITEEIVRQSLNQILEAYKGRYPDTQTYFNIYAYETEAHAKGFGPHQLGRLEWRERESHKPPHITIEVQNLLAATNPNPPENRFGFTEKQRRDIWTEFIIVAEYQAQREASRRYPSPTKPGEVWQGDKWGDLYDNLNEQYEREILAKHGLSKEQFDSICDESILENWPSPPKPNDIR